jgi:hypothetical protein
VKDRGRNTRRAPARPLLAFVVDDYANGSFDEDVCAELVYALDELEARAIAAPWIAWRSEPETHLRVRRVPEADAWARDHRRREFRNEPLRLAGFREEGDSGCSECGLADLRDFLDHTAGRREEWAVCYECGLCGQCGHSSDCAELDPAKQIRLLRRDMAKHLRICAVREPGEPKEECFSCHCYERCLVAAKERLATRVKP